MWCSLLSTRCRFKCKGDGLSRLTSGLEIKKLLMSFWPFCVLAFINDFRYAKKDKTYSQYENTLLASPGTANVEFHHNEIDTDSLVASSRVFLVVSRRISVSEELYANYRKSEFAS